MKMDQIAFYARTEEERDRIKAMFGVKGSPWVKDTVLAQSVLPLSGSNFPVISVADLEFNYALGVELEILCYQSQSPNWHNWNFNVEGWPSFISHIGIHLEDDEDFPVMDGCPLVQETRTLEHSAPYLVANGRKYHYRIYQLAPGSYIKYIKRIHAKEA